ncbi:MAG: hypothetical protein WB615_12510 [Candidatus Tumulicola sp.]
MSWFPAWSPKRSDAEAVIASEQRKAGLAWRDDESLDRVDFRRDILPKRRSLPVRVVAEAMDFKSLGSVEK